jgi:hypothetical protein
MPHPSLGLPPHDTTAGLPEAAARLRANRTRLARLALAATVAHVADFEVRYDDLALRRFLRDYDRHIEQLARALETGEDGYVTNYGEWLVPLYRRRRVPMSDLMALLAGLQQAAASVLTPAENEAAAEMLRRWADRLRHHARLAGDHKGNALLRFFWKGAGVGDDKWV